MEINYKGEIICDGTFSKQSSRHGENCDRKAYYLDRGNYRCGMHSKKETRQALPENPNKDKIKEDRVDKMIADAMDIMGSNLVHGERGKVIVTKLKMRKAPKITDGYIACFPNFRDGGRKDGLGLPSLSPMAMGPIKHYCPGIPFATCLENFWQGSKCFVCEFDDDNGGPADQYYDTRNETFDSKNPRRHKRVTDHTQGVKCSVWYDVEGKIHMLSYVESRQVYCNIYEHFASNDENFKEIMNFCNHGLNLEIFGYDGHDVNAYSGDSLKEKFETCYLDPKEPFGHEMCLQAMLLLPYEDRPWRKYTTIDAFEK